MLAADLREMTDEELGHELTNARQELFRLRFQASTEKLEAPSNLKKLRRDIARIHTIRRQREIAATSDSSATPAAA